MYIDREESNARAIMHEGLNGPENGNMFEEEISLEFTRDKLIFCNWLPDHKTSEFCVVFFRDKRE